MRSMGMNPYFVDAAVLDPRYIADMSAAQFCDWLLAMKISGAAAARLLGVNVNTITRYRRNGGPRMLALACAALYHRLGEGNEH